MRILGWEKPVAPAPIKRACFYLITFSLREIFFVTFRPRSRAGAGDPRRVWPRCCKCRRRFEDTIIGGRRGGQPWGNQRRHKRHFRLGKTAKKNSLALQKTRATTGWMRAHSRGRDAPLGPTWRPCRGAAKPRRRTIDRTVFAEENDHAE